ncbi:hypothetical protein ALO43_200372 [Pseudomonas tremae]|uniref:Thymidylate kinase n=1 Tax=Pseudomonas tremae TaxID=200454 RepID=A0AA40P6D1_9PSED|nr:hypothetical protein ALO43_200372 [Pseudomonas tremae]
MILKALYRHRDHFALLIIRPCAADFLRFERVVFRTMTVDHLDIAAPLFGPQAVCVYLTGEQCAEQAQGHERFC